jgi:hypothetical protein
LVEAAGAKETRRFIADLTVPTLVNDLRLLPQRVFGFGQRRILPIQVGAKI